MRRSPGIRLIYEWKEREALIQGGKALNVDGNPHKELFVKDKAEDQHGKSRWVCVKCLRFGHTTPFCDDLKRATSSWQLANTYVSQQTPMYGENLCRIEKVTLR